MNAYRRSDDEADAAWARFIAAKALKHAEEQLAHWQERYDEAWRVLHATGSATLKVSNDLTAVLVDIARSQT